MVGTRKALGVRNDKTQKRFTYLGYRLGWDLISSKRLTDNSLVTRPSENFVGKEK